jgi:hypothetical protein
VFAQVTLETSAGQQPRVFTVVRDEHLRAGFRVRGPARADHGRQHQGLVGEAGAGKEREETVERHEARKYSQIVRRALARGGV